MHMVPETAWLGEYRDLVGGIIRLCNAYANGAPYFIPYRNGSVFLSTPQVQTIEYILESRDEKMSELAERLGVSRSAFSNNVKRLEALGLVDKRHKDSNRKDVFLAVTPLGKEIYHEYSQGIYTAWFQGMFAMADEISKEDITQFTKIMNGFADACHCRSDAIRSPKAAQNKRE